MGAFLHSAIHRERFDQKESSSVEQKNLPAVIVAESPGKIERPIVTY
jgi:hypothetical protein